MLYTWRWKMDVRRRRRTYAGVAVCNLYPSVHTPTTCERRLACCCQRKAGPVSFRSLGGLFYVRTHSLHTGWAARARAVGDQIERFPRLFGFGGERARERESARFPSVGPAELDVCGAPAPAPSFVEPSPDRSARDWRVLRCVRTSWRATCLLG